MCIFSILYVVHGLPELADVMREGLGAARPSGAAAMKEGFIGMAMQH